MTCADCQARLDAFIMASDGTIEPVVLPALVERLGSVAVVTAEQAVIAAAEAWDREWLAAEEFTEQTAEECETSEALHAALDALRSARKAGA